MKPPVLPTSPLALALALALPLASCATTSLQPSSDWLADAERRPGDARVHAADARVTASKKAEWTAGLVDEVELQVSQRPADDGTPLADGTRVSVQVPVNSPWRTSAERRARKAETEEAETQRDQASLDRDVQACFAGVALTAVRERREAWEPLAQRLEALLAIVARQYEAGILTEAEALRVEIETRTRLVGKQPRPPRPQLHPEWPLPELDPNRPPLDASPERIRELVRRHHPEPRRHEATARRWAAYASRERAGTLPWFDHVRLDYDLPRIEREREGGFGGRIALGIPFGFGARADAARYDGRSAEEAWEAAARVAEQTQSALVALQELAFLEARAGHFRDVLALAEQAEATVNRLLPSGREKPSDLIKLLVEAQDGRQAVISAREDAGKSACTLLEATGVRLENWPRLDPAGP